MDNRRTIVKKRDSVETRKTQLGGGLDGDKVRDETGESSLAWE